VTGRAGRLPARQSRRRAAGRHDRSLIARASLAPRRSCWAIEGGHAAGRGRRDTAAVLPLPPPDRPPRRAL